jgi:hypothetical protein
MSSKYLETAETRGKHYSSSILIDPEKSAIFLRWARGVVICVCVNKYIGYTEKVFFQKLTREAFDVFKVFAPENRVSINNPILIVLAKSWG